MNNYICKVKFLVNSVLLCFIIFACPMISLAQYLNSGARPSWTTKISKKLPEWSKWHNALKPKGKGIVLDLTKDGTTCYVIVHPEKPTIREKKAAEELQLWLGKITGAKFPIVSDKNPAQATEIHVGQTILFKKLDQVKAPKPGMEGYGIAIDGKRLFLYGGKGLMGPLPAVFALLEEDLGVRWWLTESTGKKTWGEWARYLKKSWAPESYFLQKQSTLNAKIVPRKSTPAFLGRNVASYIYTSSPWAIRNRTNYSVFPVGSYGQRGYTTGGFFVHTYLTLVPPKKYFPKHPEYYSLIKGKRRYKRGQLCLTNPEVAKVATKTIITRRGKSLKKNPYVYMISISAMDWGNECKCEKCLAAIKKLGSYGALQLQFANNIANTLASEYPKVLITSLVYRHSKKAPKNGAVKAAKNVAIRFCTDFDSSFPWPYHSFKDTKLTSARKCYDKWNKITDRMHLWIYPHQYGNMLAPMSSIRAVAENIRFFRDRKAKIVLIQQRSGDFGRRQMRYWIFGRLLWDPDLDISKLILDFTWAYYGKAASMVMEYNDLLLTHCLKYTDFSRKRGWRYSIHKEKMYNFGFVKKSLAILDEAMKVAENDTIRDRVEELKLGVIFVRAAQLYTKVRDGKKIASWEEYDRISVELFRLCKRFFDGRSGFFDGSYIGMAVDFKKKMNKVKNIFLNLNVLPQSTWGKWVFRKDPQNIGIKNKWYAVKPVKSVNLDKWKEVKVPAFLSKSGIDKLDGYGWYRVEFNVPQKYIGRNAEISFESVDEQAWIYLNGKYLGEHTLESEFTVGFKVTVDYLWNRPFDRKIPSSMLKAGKNVLAVRIHNIDGAAGIYGDVKIVFAGKSH